MAQLRAVLATPDVRGLLGSSLLGRLPTAMAPLAVLLLVTRHGGTFTRAGVLTALVVAGTAVGQPLFARLVDRRGQVLPLLAAAVLSTAAFVVLALSAADDPLPAGFAAAIAGVGTPPLEPCLRALWPQVVGTGPLLGAALSLDVGAQEIVYVVGPVLTTGLVALGADSAGVYGCAVLGLLGTLAFVSRRTPRRWRPTPVTGRRGTPLRLPAFRRIVLTTLACGVPVGALAVVATAYADGHGAGWVAGWALAANAAGALAAGLYGAARSLAVPLPAAALGLAVGYLPLALPVPPVAWVLLAVLSGLSLPVVLTAVFGDTHRICPAEQLTEANAWIVTAFGIGAAGAAAIAGVVSDHLGLTAVWVVVLAAAAVTAVGAATSARFRRPASVSRARPPQP